MNEPYRLKSTQEKALESEQSTQSSQATTHEFETVEELLRHDAMHTPVPPGIEVRLKDSIAAEPASAPKSWWRKWLEP